MARAYASIVLKAPVETAWSLVRDFNGLPGWAPAVVRSEIEEGLDADVVGCVRSLHLKDGRQVRERLLSLDDARRSFTYNFEKPAFPVRNYVASLRLFPVTHGDGTFAEWEASFDEAAGDEGRYERIISREVFAANLASLAKLIAETKPAKPAGAERWKGFAPNKVWTSRVLRAPVEQVWGVMRDFAGMAAWHEDITRMHMLGGVRSDKVSGVRDFHFGEGHLNEELLHLCDRSRSFSYRITNCEMPWINYVSGARLWPVTAGGATFAVWTGDWDASPQDDLVLMPQTEQNVYQKALATVERRLRGR
ncbi:Polyketide cyclase / dehydrase and lipid transport [Tistlia consotensis]|uniref:Polyketide cyclase / dehydrase and lipid transport n=1 Tax=Tistlia consotensis USBA 355 TaxID=560819 RepID=A0A1Y6CLE3_9PROT|nr:SRPBCC family protein [Tistlia consotensis]SMF73671.1 Polyketide cyclase / dehydrase and lipid transport [Tistlia consotensis USBA 355]SNS28424.1 Polyketide cyclase / dehydrase and lipid transport [Tistlia consotensis]